MFSSGLWGPLCFLGFPGRGEKRKPPPPPPNAAGWFGAMGAAGQFTAKPSEHLEALLHLVVSLFFLGLLPHLWKRWRGGPGHLSRKRSQISNGTESVYH